ncbi:MAG: GNAT family N-acetyltransferase [Ginsengibacter sp.]
MVLNQNPWANIKDGGHMKENIPKYDIVEGTGSDEELKTYKDCFDQNKSEKDLATLIWLHQDNLRKEQSILYALEPESRNIAAIYTYLPTVVKCMQTNIPALQSFDTLTDHRHRGKGLFIQLATKLAQKEKERGNALVFGFPNENSVNGFVKKLGFTYFGEVPFLIKPLKISYFIKKFFRGKDAKDSTDSNCTIESKPGGKLKNNISLKRIENFGEDYDELWQNIKSCIPVCVNRDAAYMNWRFVDKPKGNYSIYGYYEGTELKGIVIFTLKNKHGGKVGYLMELLFNPQNKPAGKELLRFSLRILKKNNADVILAWCYPHSFNYLSFKSVGFYNFPEKIRPQKLGVIIKVLKSTFEKEILKIKNWYISYGDSDTV